MATAPYGYTYEFDENAGFPFVRFVSGLHDNPFVLDVSYTLSAGTLTPFSLYQPAGWLILTGSGLDYEATSYYHFDVIVRFDLEEYVPGSDDPNTEGKYYTIEDRVLLDVYVRDAADNMVGGNGADRFRVNVGNDVLDGRAGADELFSGIDNDTLRGGTGNDWLGGGPGDDIIDGGSDYDTADYSDAEAGVRIKLALTGQQDTGGGGKDTLVNVENLVGSDFDDELIGNSRINILSGRDGNDRLDGGRAADTMIGGGGDDLFLVDNAGDVVREALGGGVDRIVASASYGLANGVEVESLVTPSSSGFLHINLTGNSWANVLIGNAATNRLEGEGGNDTLSGAAGNDILDGGSYHDMLIGGLGADRMAGGLGHDTFDFNTVSESMTGSQRRDVILDFSRTQGDRIDLSTIDANSPMGGDQAFSFIGSSIFSGHAGELRNVSGFLRGDTDGDKIVDFEILVAGAPDLRAGIDLIL